MGYGDQPYIYEPQNRRVAYPYSDYNPKAVTQASYQKLATTSQSPERKKQDGPLLNFNQHPDSYMFVGGQNADYKPMSPNTKKKVTVLRWIQFALRTMQEIGALGMLVAVICIRGMVTSMSWITRIAPAVDIVITIYAIYHLARSPKARPPMSSASYHTFAVFMDVGLIPFYVFIAIFAYNNWTLSPGNEDRWTSFFTADGATSILLYATFVGSTVVASLHAISTFFDLWLVILFRKIANLPPDVNPLEDNLTSRKASKHKYKNSEATLTGSFDEKNSKHTSGSTLSVDQQSRLSTAIKDVPDARHVPFRHSRTGSELGYSPHNPDSVRWSRQQMEQGSMYQHPQSARGSMASVRPHSRGNSMSPSKNPTFTMTEIPSASRQSSRPISYPTSQIAGTFNGTRNSAPPAPKASPSNALVKSQQRNDVLEQDNWFVFEEDDVTDAGQTTDHYAGQDGGERHDSFEPRPLRMNPPTPPPPPSNSDRPALSVRSDNGNADLSRHLTVTSTTTAGSSVYSESAPSLKSSSRSPGTPKSKYYGDLAAATRGVLRKDHDSYDTLRTVDAAGHDTTGMSALGSHGYNTADVLPSFPKARGAPKADRTGTGFKSNDTLKSNATVEVSGVDSTGMSALGRHGFACPSPPPKVPKINRDGNGRVVSRTGVDLADASEHMVQPGRRRDVSGKIAEEGRGGGWRRY